MGGDGIGRGRDVLRRFRRRRDIDVGSSSRARYADIAGGKRAGPERGYRIRIPRDVPDGASSAAVGSIEARNRGRRLIGAELGSDRTADRETDYLAFGRTDLELHPVQRAIEQVEPVEHRLLCNRRYLGLQL